ncbi:tetratricopeptide repeat protein (plasmid) [Acaryochloris sp. 'Moss Beach']|nr:tetratricopeptide repeat protein [Acaryochloris sp. 'Moss Beach']
MGGIGKTELALQYAISQLELKHYPGGFCWLRARDQEIATQIVSFAQTKLGLTFPDGLDEQGQVEYCWGHWREGEVLIVLDDVTEFDAVEPYLPPSDPKFKVLLTTRLKLGSSVQSLSIEELDDESALALLETLVGSDRIQSQLEDAKTLCDWVGNLPLGLELLGRFLARKLDWPLKKLIERLESKRLEAQALIARESGMTAQLGVAAALELSWVELSEAEQELACLLGMFAVAPIPWHLVEGCLSDQDKDDLEDIRDEGLKDRNLLKRVEENTYQLHQIVQEFFRVKLKECSDEGQSLKTAFCKAMVDVAQGIDNIPTIDVIGEMRVNIPHLEEVVKVWRDHLNEDDLTLPYIGICRFYEGQGSYGLALPWMQLCLKHVADRQGEENLDIATITLWIAYLYNNQGRYSEAEPLLVQALEMTQTLLGNEHPDVAISMWCLGALYQKQGRNEDAEDLYRKALVIFEEKLGSNHPHTERLRSFLASIS